MFKDWLAARPDAWRASIEVVAMDGFSGFKTAAAEEISEATAVMDPFHVVCLAADASTAAGGVSSSSSTATADDQATRSTPPDGPSAPATTYSPTSSARD